MSGRSDRDKGSWDHASSQYLASANGTGKHRALPQRPRNMTRLDTPPTMPRVGRPKHEAPPPKRWRR